MVERERALDSIDMKILRLLEEDSRTPWSRLARKLGVSETTVYLRVRKLMEMGVLEGFTTRVNLAKLGLTSTAYVLLKVKVDGLELLRKAVAENPYVVEAYEVFAGEYNVLVKLVARSQEEVAEQVDRIMSIPGIQGFLTVYSIRSIKSRSRILDIITR